MTSGDSLLRFAIFFSSGAAKNARCSRRLKREAPAAYIFKNIYIYIYIYTVYRFQININFLFIISSGSSRQVLSEDLSGCHFLGGNHNFYYFVKGLFDSRVNEQRVDEWDLSHHWRCSITFACLWLDRTDWRAFLLYHISARVIWWTACCIWLTLLFHRTASSHACMHRNIRHLVPLLVFRKPPVTRLHVMGELKKILTPFTACPINSRGYTAPLLT